MNLTLPFRRYHPKLLRSLPVKTRLLHLDRQPQRSTVDLPRVEEQGRPHQALHR